MPHIARLIERHATYRPDYEAIVFEGQRLTYQQFFARINKLSHALKADGFVKGDKIASVLPNKLELLDFYWACAQSGLVMVPLSPLMQATGLAKLLDGAGAKMVVTCQTYLPLVLEAAKIYQIERILVVDGDAPAGTQAYGEYVSDAPDHAFDGVEIDDDDLYNIIYSSGTTGEPKGIQHTHFIRAMYCTLFSQSFRFTPESVCLHTGAIIFNGAFVPLMPTFYNGAKYIMHPAFDIEKVVATIEREKVTHIMMVPAQIQALLDYPDIKTEMLESLEMIMSLGAPLPLEHKEALDRLLPGRFYELYGLTEGFVTILDKTDFHKKSGSVGSCPPFFEIRICDEDGQDVPIGEVGEIVGRSPIMTPGYYNKPDLTADTIKDGWLFTGDLGRLDEEGYLYLVDRKKDMIISGGVNVYPKDIEEVVACHPMVNEVAVFGTADDKWGETPVCAVILKRDQSIAAEALKEWVNVRVDAKFQRVKEVRIFEDFPRSVAGKTLKREMKEAW
ncbi:AMP-binding protein [Terasakiella sp. A23]|uniref:class I adenylate-forming enzyme family protein n=1 Tax=Terasakiella sp. FCG-A23 TaxID=3080561 RepID=UPI00295577C0|nr:AMP-binding protein [Terasakiella sp. A23]MDV7340607.1 AMP-binding protein [Terasakiella sp. A23]